MIWIQRHAPLPQKVTVLGQAGSWQARQSESGARSRRGSRAGSFADDSRGDDGVSRWRFSVRLPAADWAETDGQIAEAFNQTIAPMRRISEEVTRLSETVGKEGRLKQRMSMPGARGEWAESVDSINTLVDDLVRPTTEIARTIGAVAKGDLGQSMELEIDGHALKGEFLRSAKLMNAMVDQLRSFASEVTRVAREVGTEGQLGVQAKVPGVAGTWKDLTESVNMMGSQPDRPGAQHRGRHHGRGQWRPVQEDHRRREGGDPRAEEHHQHDGGPAQRHSPREVTRVAREVGTEGKLGGQARGARRGRHLEGPHRQRQLHGLQPHRPGARHRQGRDGGGQRQPVPEAHRAGQGRSRRAGRHDQQHDRHAGDLRRAGDQRGARSRRRRPARRPGERPRRRRHVEGPHRQRQSARRQPHHAGARHRRGRHRRDQGRPDALHPGGATRRGGRAEGQHQHDDLQPARDHREQPRAGLAEDQPRQVHRHAPGPARPGHRGPDAARRAGAAGQGPAGHDLPAGRQPTTSPS